MRGRYKCVEAVNPWTAVNVWLANAWTAVEERPFRAAYVP
jgi:hypothetical protein